MSFHFFIEGVFTPLLGIFGVVGNLVRPTFSFYNNSILDTSSPKVVTSYMDDPL
jgi:hypothetical protein